MWTDDKILTLLFATQTLTTHDMCVICKNVLRKTVGEAKSLLSTLYNTTEGMFANLLVE